VLADDPSARLVAELNASFAAAPARLRGLVRARALSAAGLHAGALRLLLAAYQRGGQGASRLASEELVRALRLAGEDGPLLDELLVHAEGRGPAPELCLPR
jgi:hypothetical protein